MKAEVRDILERHGATFDDAGLDPRADVTRATWLAAARDLLIAGFEFSDLTALDREDAVEIVLWLLVSPAEQFSLRTSCPNEDLRLDTLSGVCAPAEWAEREIYDLFGVEFTGHPDLSRILQPDDATIFPLRRSYMLEERPW